MQHSANAEFGTVHTCAYLVDLEQRCRFGMNIDSQTLASIQLRTSPDKFAVVTAREP